METTLPYIGLLARYPSVVSAILAFFYVFLVRGVEVSKACHWPVQEMVQVTLSLTGSLNVCSRAGTLPAAGAAKRDLNSCSWNFPAVCINMAYTCKSMADQLVANLHILPSSMYFTLKMDAYASPLAMYLSISPHIHIQAYRNAIKEMASLDEYIA